MRDVLARYDVIPPADLNQMLVSFDVEHRPLFALFLADALRSSGATPDWDTEKLIHYVLKREITRWDQQGVKEPDRKLLKFATLAGKIDLKANLPSYVEDLLRQAYALPKPPSFDERLSCVLHCKWDQQSIPKMEPDLLGELFVLQTTVLGNNKFDENSEKEQRQFKAAWRVASGLGILSFVLRAAQDFPLHANLEGLIGQLAQHRQQGKKTDFYLACMYLALSTAFHKKGRFDAVIRTLAAFDSQRKSTPYPKSPLLRQVELNICVTRLVALALAGDIETSLKVGRRAVKLAKEKDGTLTQESISDAISTYANVLLAQDPDEAATILRKLHPQLKDIANVHSSKLNSEITLAMSLIVIAHRDYAIKPAESGTMFAEALAFLHPLFIRANEHSRFAEAAASALLIGLIHALEGTTEDFEWFTQAVNAAIQAGQLETLWRAHLNLASALHRQQYDLQKVREHAHAAYVLLDASLSTYPHPEDSPRFNLVRIPLAHAIRFLVEAGDVAGAQALADFPTIKNCFAEKGASLREDRGGFSSHEWLRVKDYDFILY